MWKIFAVVVASLAGACVMEEPQTTAELGPVDVESESVTLDDEYVLAASDCPAEADCEHYPEVTLSQCLAACQAGSEAIAALCRVILHPVVKKPVGAR